MTAKPAKRPELRTEADRAKHFQRLSVRLPLATARQLELLAKRRGLKRVTVLCDLINSASVVQKDKP